MKRVISIAILAGALCAATTHAQTASGNRATVPWSDPSKPGLVKVNIGNGSITVKTHAGKDVIVESTRANRRGRTRTPDRNVDGLTLISGSGAGFAVEEANNVLTVSAGFFGDSGNIDIQVPVKTNLNLSTMHGNVISVDGVEGDIEVKNMNGDMRFVNVSGSVVASAQNGNVLATIRDVASIKPMSFVTFHGNIDVTLNPAAKASLRLSTDHGDVWSGFEIKMAPGAVPTFESSRGGSRISFDRTQSGTINGGGTPIELRTFHGNIYVRKGN